MCIRDRGCPRQGGRIRGWPSCQCSGATHSGSASRFADGPWRSAPRCRSRAKPTTGCRAAT
eukprot:6838031-Lingulodinium_polyedra.AAC.1